MEKGLRIAMFGQKRVPSREGGVEVVVGELSARLAALGCQVTCFNRNSRKSAREGGNSRPKEYRGVRLRSVFTVDKKGVSAVVASFLAALRAGFGRYDVVHVHAEGQAVFCWIPKLLGKRIVVTVHGLDWEREKWQGRLASRYIRWGERAAVRFADGIIVLSRRIQEYFWNTYGQRTTWIPNGVEGAHPRPPERIGRQFGLEKDGYLLFLGRLVPEKGLRCLVRAFRQVRTGKRLIIAGKASDTEEFESELRELSRGDGRICFVGFVQGEILEELYSNAYVYVLPSDLEGMPLGLLEAMSYANCCVVSDIPECTEVVEDKAVVFPRGDEERLRAVLQRLIDCPEEVRAYKKEAAEFIRGKYSWDDVLRRTLEVYRQKSAGRSR